MDTTIKRRLGIALAVIGFILILINAADYLGGLSLAPQGTFLFGLFFVLIGMFAAKRKTA